MKVIAILKHKRDNSFVFLQLTRTANGIEIIEIKKVEKEITSAKRTIKDLSVLKTEGYVLQVSIPKDVFDRFLELILLG